MFPGVVCVTMVYNAERATMASWITVDVPIRNIMDSWLVYFWTFNSFGSFLLPAGQQEIGEGSP
jgi:hypothetical protein